MAKKISGVVVSDAPDKSIIVKTTRRITHPVYGKSYLVSKKFTAHDEKNEAKVGDKVIIAETRPISKTKRFTLDSITNRGHKTIEIAKTEVEQEIDEKLAAKTEKKAAKETLEASSESQVEEAKNE